MTARDCLIARTEFSIPGIAFTKFFSLLIMLIFLVIVLAELFEEVRKKRWADNKVYCHESQPHASCYHVINGVTDTTQS